MMRTMIAAVLAAGSMAACAAGTPQAQVSNAPPAKAEGKKEMRAVPLRNPGF